MAKESLRNVIGWALAYGLLGRFTWRRPVSVVTEAWRPLSRTRRQAARERPAPPAAQGGMEQRAASPSSVSEPTFR